MSILKSYNDGTLTELNSLRYSEIPRGTGPLVEAKIPTNALEQGPSRDGLSNAISVRTEDVERLGKLLQNTPAGIKFGLNQGVVHAAEAKQYLVKGEKENAINTAGKLAGVLDTTPIAAGVAGTGLHTVHGGLEGPLGEWHKYLGKDANSRSLYKGTVELTETDRDRISKLKNQSASTGISLDYAINVNKDKKNKITQDKELGEKRYVNIFVVSGKDHKKELRINLGDPGKISYNLKDSVDKTKEAGIDGINALSLSDDPLDGTKESRDLIKFRFEVITPDSTKYLYFRAFLDSFQDSHTGNWSSFNYVGRGEQFHTYNTYQRSVNLGFKIAAQSRWEMKPLYEKINWLASATAPTYSTEGFMRGTFVRLTVGSYLDSVPGILESVNYTWQTDYPWEIAMNQPERGSDNNMKELPMVLDCSIQFRPIHDSIQKTEKTTFVTSDTPTEEFKSVNTQ